MKRWKKRCLIAVGTLLLLVLVLFGIRMIGGSEQVSDDTGFYEEIRQEYEMLPPVSELEKNGQVRFQYYKKRDLFFISESYTMQVQYAQEDFQSRVEQLENQFVFQQEPLEDGKAPKFSMDGISFRMLSMEHYEMMYPHQMVFVGVSEETREVIYIAFYDADLDLIDTPFPEFLRETCGWNKFIK